MTKIITSDGPAGSNATSSLMDNLLQELRDRKGAGKGHRWEDFSFDQSQQSLKDVPGNFSDAVEDERNS